MQLVVFYPRAFIFDEEAKHKKLQLNRDTEKGSFNFFFCCVARRLNAFQGRDLKE